MGEFTWTHSINLRAMDRVSFKSKVMNLRSSIHYYVAVLNDATILKEELKKDEKLRRFLTSFNENWNGEVKLVIDRGYR